MARKSRKGGAVQAVVQAEFRWNVAPYARLSLEDSGRKGADTIETQIELMHSYVSSRTDLSIYETYVDNGSSGADFDRPAWNRMMNDIRFGKVNCIVVKDLSRFARNYIEACELLDNIFPFMGVRFISINNGYDSEQEGGHSEALLVSLKNLINDHYVREISRKVSSSLKVRRERGEYCGAFAPFGYKKSKTVKNMLEPDEETAPIVRDIFLWRSQGMGQSAICKRLDALGIPIPSEYNRQRHNITATDYYKAKVWQPKAIKRMIASQIYIGHLEQGKTRQALYAHKPLEIVPENEWHITLNAHEPIVPMDLWQAANAVSAQRRAKYHDDLEFPDLPDNIFRGFLVCGSCGSKLVRRHSKTTNPSGKQYEYFYYSCSLAHQHPEDTFSMVRFEGIYNAICPAVIGQLKLVSDMGRIIEKLSKSRQSPRDALNKEIARATQELEKINQRLAGLYDRHAEKDLTEREYVRFKEEYTRNAEAVRVRIDDLSQRVVLMSDAFNSENRWLKVAKAFLSPKELTREME